jgi:hypothetical protein
MIGNPSTEKLSVRQLRERIRKRLRRQFPQPHWHSGRSSNLSEGPTFDRARDRRRRIEPTPRNGQCEKQAGKARGKISNALMPRCQEVHRNPKAWMKSLELAFRQIAKGSPLARSRHKFRGHFKSPQYGSGDRRLDCRRADSD